MKFNEDLAAVHGYLCADGYVITNPPTQSHKYYIIGLRNTNYILLKDFQKRFERVFGSKPSIIKDGRCRIHSKEIYYVLTKKYTYYSDKWKMPKIPKQLMRFWLRAYFDCDGWVSVIKAKDRKIGLDSINKNGLYQIKNILMNQFSIDSNIAERHNRFIWSLTICGKDDLEKFHKQIGFLHPKKAVKLQEALNSYVNYYWDIPETKDDIINFINLKGKPRVIRKEVRLLSIKKINLIKLYTKLKQFNIDSRILGPWKNNLGTEYYCLTLKMNDEEVKK